MSLRKIACHRLWTDGEILCNPLVSIGPDGRIVAVTRCDRPDTEPLTEFHAGVMVPDFPADFRTVFDGMLARRTKPLADLLSETVARPCGERCTVMISGVEYEPLRLTERAQIVKIQ